LNRRTFARTVAATALAAVAPPLPAEEPSAASSPDLAFGAGETLESSVTPSYPLSIMLWTIYKELPFEDRLAKVAEAGYSNVQLVGEYRNWTPADFDRANAARKRLGIHIDATAGLNHGVANPEVRDAFLAELTEALLPMQTLGCPAMIVLSGNVVPGLSHQDQHESSVETLKAAAKRIEGKTIDGQPVRLLLECIHLEENPKYFLTSASEAIEIVRAVNHPQVQFLYDIYHEQMSFGDLITKLEKHIDVIGLIHIADVPGRHQPGTGEIHYANIYRKLQELNYKHNIAMEFYPTGDPIAILGEAKSQALSRGAA
jgi:hydroxypyruvate isomerase